MNDLSPVAAAIQISNPESVVDLVARLTLAALYGGIIGFERDVHGRSAGLRTHLLVCLGSCLFTLVSLCLPALAQTPPADPGRVAAQIVTGIGFLGAGVVLKLGVTVRGLTTAACLWVTAALGMAAGTGMYWISAYVTALTLATLVALNWFERAFRHDTYRKAVVFSDVDADVGKILEAVRSTGITVLACDIDRDYVRGELLARIDVRIFHRGPTDPIAQRVLEALRNAGVPVQRFQWKR